MGKICAKIVLTGGPCAGKTTALSRIEEDLSEKGFKVFIVSESATELIKGGIKPFGNSQIELLKFQELILKYQLSKESIYEEAILSLPENDKCVIIYDRGIMDNKAYINNNQFKSILKALNLQEINILDNYDLVLHLVTAADGKEKYYTLANNTARTETVEEAIALDKKTANAWNGHNNLIIIDNSTNFEDKLNRSINAIRNLLGYPITLKKQKKYQIDLNNSNLDFLNAEDCIKVEIEQTYLYNENDDPSFERRLRRKTIDNISTYYLTVQSKKEKGLAKIATDKKITYKEYEKIKESYDKSCTINKIRYSFIRNKQYFKLDIYDNNLAILEIEPTAENKVITIPEELKVMAEVTNNDDFQNFNLAKEKKEKSKKTIKQLNYLTKNA